MSDTKPPSPDWRSQQQSRSSYTRAWRGTRIQSGLTVSRDLKLRFIGFGVLALSILTFLLILNVGPNSTSNQVLTLGVGVYGLQSSVPLNPFGQQDAEAFGLLSDKNPKQFPTIRDGTNSLNKQGLLSICENQAKIAHQNLIVFCTLHAVVQSDEVQLFAIDAVPETDRNMIPLSDLLDRLRESRAKHVLLALDTSRLPSKWSLGILGNDVAEQIQAKWPAKNRSKDKIAILLAAGVGESSWPKGDNSAFAYYLIDGLLGKADGWQRDARKPDAPARKTENEDQVVSLDELADYMQFKVSQWSRNRYGSFQTVQLLGNTSSFEIASVVSRALSLADEIAALRNAISEKDKPDPPAGRNEEKPSEKIVAPSVTESVRNEETAKALWRVHESLRSETSKDHPSIRTSFPLAWLNCQDKLKFAEAMRLSGPENLRSRLLEEAKKDFDELRAKSGVLAVNEDLENLGFAWGETAPGIDVIDAVDKFFVEVDGKDLKQPNAMALQAWMAHKLDTIKTIQEWKPVRRPSVPTPDVLFILNVLEAKLTDPKIGESADPRQGADNIARLLKLRKSFRELAVRFPDAWDLVKDDLQSSVRFLNAADRWMSMTYAGHPKVGELSKNAEIKLQGAEKTARLFYEALAIWGDLVSELPPIAEWLAVQVNDEEQQNLEWFKNWVANQINGSWELADLEEAWPERQSHITDIAKHVLKQFVDAQKLKQAIVALLAERKDESELAKLSKLVDDSSMRREQFASLFDRYFNEQMAPFKKKGCPDARPTALRESYRLLYQSWLPENLRLQLLTWQTAIDDCANNSVERAADKDRLAQVDVPNGQSVATLGIWQGFWALSSLDLLTAPQLHVAQADKSAFWRGDITQAKSLFKQMLQVKASDSDELRDIRNQLGREIREQYRRLHAPWDRSTSNSFLPRLRAATLEPFSLPKARNDPDKQIAELKQLRFAKWLNLFSSTWRNQFAGGVGSFNQRLNETVRGILRKFDQDERLQESPPPILGRQELDPVKFADDFKGELALPPLLGKENRQLHLWISGDGVRLATEAQKPLAAGFKRSYPTDEKLLLKLDDPSTIRTLDIVVAEADDYPLDFYSVQCVPPFNPSLWRIEFIDASSKEAILWDTFEHSRKSNHEPSLIELKLPPQGLVKLNLNLVRPDKDPTASAEVAVFRIVDPADPDPADTKGRVVVKEPTKIALKPGAAKTAITFEPPSSKEKLPNKETAASNSSPRMDLEHGWMFQITPNGQQPMKYLIRPRFYPATKYVKEPTPKITGEKFALTIERTVAKTAVPPEKIPVVLRVPELIAKKLKQTALDGKLKPGDVLPIGFEMPGDWNELLGNDPRNRVVKLNVAGIPHAFAWRIESSGEVTSIFKEKREYLETRLLIEREKTAGNQKPVIYRPKVGNAPKELLTFEFQINSMLLESALPKGEETFGYSVKRVMDGQIGEVVDSPKPRPIYSSLQRHVFLNSIEGNTWVLETESSDFQEQPNTEALSGRFQVSAELKLKDGLRLLSVPIVFAIDEDEPSIGFDVVGGDRETKATDKDLQLTIVANDAESGINRIVFGFDENDDETLKAPKDRIMEIKSEASDVNLDDVEMKKRVVIPKKVLADLVKDSKAPVTKTLMVGARNGAGFESWASKRIVLQNPQDAVAAAAEGQTGTGDLTITLVKEKFPTWQVDVSGPEERSEKVKMQNHYTFRGLKSGTYQVKIKLTVGGQRSWSGTAKVKPDANEPKEITLSDSQ